MNEYNLTYIEKSTGKKFPAKTLAGQRVKLLDPETQETTIIGNWDLRKRFRSHRLNRSRPFQKILTGPSQC
jgi:hypothetical protein